ncbi:uncharacterized protein LOC122982140 [Thunnus albacares]|uniref:uncharacterized protein LOC122982140 n=1 Tax=Thunnus albacares TaxID=8236 RepID=UPI001CF660DC|nr:uncharacterized protein LOC122982140 [Thunnus albacares]
MFTLSQQKAKDTSVTAHIIGVMEVDSNKEELEVLLETGEISALNKVQSGRDPIPVKRVALRQDTVSVNLSLWREAAITDLNIGDRVQFSHVKACTTDYGLQLQTTNYTKIEVHCCSRCFFIFKHNFRIQ